MTSSSVNLSNWIDNDHKRKLKFMILFVIFYEFRWIDCKFYDCMAEYQQKLCR